MFQQKVKLTPVEIELTILIITGLEIWCLSSCANPFCVKKEIFEHEFCFMQHYTFLDLEHFWNNLFEDILFNAYLVCTIR